MFGVVPAPRPGGNARARCVVATPEPNQFASPTPYAPRSVRAREQLRERGHDTDGHDWKYQTPTGATHYMVLYRTPQRTQTTKRGFTTKRAAQALANMVEVEQITGNYIAPSRGQVTVGELG
jgi:hypothetical protein